MPYRLLPCPVCGAADAELVADGAAIRAEVEALWAFHLRRLRDGAPIAELYDRAVFSQRAPLELVACPGCGTLRRDPAEAPRDLVRGYAAEALDGAVLDALRQAQRPFFEAAERRLRRALGGTGAVLEVGSYAGGFLDVARERGWRVRGIDVNEGAAAHARGRGHDVRAAGLAAAAADGAAGGLDAVAVWSCFEQLPEPRRAAADAARLLRPGGILALRVPSGAFYRALRGRRGVRGGAAGRALLALSNLLGFPYRHGFTPASLRRLVEEAGLRVLHARGDALVPTSGPWTRPWAAAEQRLARSALRLAPTRLSPWLELYARR